MMASMANQRASSSSASFPKSREDQVFLSFRGEDTRHNFTDHLYSALCQRGINTFRDDDDLGRGEEISRALLTAIEESKISVIVFSKNYASSRWCLDELVKILDCKESNQQRVIPVFYKVNPSDVRNQRGSFGDALANMECKYKENMPKVNKWRAALSRVADLSGFTLDEYQSESKFIQNIIEEISKHVSNFVCLEVAEHPVGMQVQVMNKLLDLGENDVRMVGVWGTGGIGKTTITKAVYNLIAREFEGCCFLANVRECSMSHGGLAKLQKTLLFEILRVEKLEVTNVDKGVTMIKEWLRRRKVLLVLDDVDDMEQLHKLVGACDWFGVGSRIIITTRDKQLLTAHDVNLIHEVKILDDPEALELFCCNAFKRSEPPLGYDKLARRAIRYAQGLPLALKVLGSCLYRGSIGKWEAALHGFKSPKIQNVLKISYNALDHSVQQVFLDIACFFKGRRKMYVTKILVACDPKAGYSIEVLVEKALISVEGDYIRMHDLLEEMGKDIVQQESPDELGGRSRLWSHEDIEHVLTNDTGTKKITSIMLNSPKRDYEIFLNVDCFLKMKNLKIFMNYNVFLSGDIGHLPNMLRVLDWHRCPLQSFPPKFHPKGLGLLNLPYSPIKQRGEGLKVSQHFTKLTILNLTGSQFLTEISDLSGSPNLRYLNAKHCKSLVQVHPSVGSLDKLQVLNFSGCCELTKFPNEVWCKSLEQLDLGNCIKLERFPEIMDKVESLNELNLFGTPIKELPASIGNLIGLTDLGLSGCPIKELPASIGNLIGLTDLGLSGCPIKELPASIGNLIGLTHLRLFGCPIKELPASIGNLIGLTHLGLSGCPIKELPASIGNLIGLTHLALSGCPIKELPASIGNLIGLTRLDLPGCPIKELPASIGNLIGLTYLDLRGCPIKELPASIGNLIGLTYLGLLRCPIKELPASIGNLIGLTYLDLRGCPIKELPASIGNLIGLKHLGLCGCPIKELPASIGNLIGLTYLGLCGCPIKELPASIGNLIGLTDLGLSGCPIKELPTSIGNLIGLTGLGLSGCPIKELPASIGNLIGLTY
ncbi:unnamed protein product [Prunus armeniaca]